ncbi:MAG: M3 family oligoendopeptidase [Candidatus Baltobacteraceae bacterium]
MPGANVLLPARNFGDIGAPPPDLAHLQAHYARLSSDLDGAANSAQALAVFSAWDGLRREFTTWASLTELHFQQDTNDPRYRAANDLLNELRPKVTGLDVAIKQKFLAGALRPELERTLGAYLFERWALDVTAFDPAIESHAVREAQIADEYTALLAGAAFDFQGERANLSTISKWREDRDREVRRQAEITKWSFFTEHASELDERYGELVRVRHEMARTLGLRDFTDLGYRRMLRTGYGTAEVARYREDIVREIVPLAQRIVQRQVSDLGVDCLMYWDEPVFDLRRPPQPPQRYAQLIASASDAFAGVDGEVGAFARLMIESDLLDLQARDGKAGGGFCTSFPAYGLPYIFANFNGTTGDVNVLLHEMGHAFQGYASRTMPVMEYLWPTYEACEVHSMSMEFFAWPQLEKFFGDDAQRYREQHLKSSLLFLPYGAAVDHFQHFVYERPDASARERNAYWKQLEATYLPWRQYGGIEHLERGGLWQAQRHIYQMPFYYIDYTLALCCALQFWSHSLDDYGAALSAYTALCRRGGELPFQELVRSAGLRSPFDAGVLRGVAERAAQVLDLP